MLDRLFAAAQARLKVHISAVEAQREQIERERAGDVARDHAGRILESPEGYSTPPPKALQNAQKAYARARREFEEHVPAALTSYTTMMLAKERLEEAERYNREHIAAEADRVHTRVHAEIRACFASMFDHGVEPRHLANVRVETIAIMSDIVKWDGHDPDMADPASPMPAIFDLYQSRLILKPGQFGDKSRSRPGVPQPQQRYTDPEHYLFNELVPSNSIVTVKVNEDAAGEPVASAQTVESIPGVEPLPPSPSPVQTETSSPLTPPADRDDAVSQAVSAELAQRIAEDVFDNDPFKLGIYWPKDGYPVGDYEPSRLIPALEKAIEADPWVGWKGFLAAARDGQAREFIAAKRQTGIARLAEELQRGEERALKDARSAGFDV